MYWHFETHEVDIEALNEEKKRWETYLGKSLELTNSKKKEARFTRLEILKVGNTEGMLRSPFKLVSTSSSGSFPTVAELLLQGFRNTFVAFEAQLLLLLRDSTLNPLSLV